MSMTMSGSRSAAVVLLLLSVVALVGCSGGDPQTTAQLEPQDEVITTLAATSDIPVIISELPPVARASDDGGEPRSAAYWALWNTCAPDNRSELAAANGGREAGWVLVDDLLADPDHAH
ncbi:MAG: hypothetical protein P1T08_18035 [Acidimicrobiia bacterium]|nr:hypothetical protein [Acidimicrobiia bacterium]